MLYFFKSWAVITVQLFFFCAFFNPFPLQAQNDSIQIDSAQSVEALYAELDAIFADETDSTLALFKLVDSLLMLEKPKYHSVIFRSSYMSQVSTAGRAQDFQENGYSTGISYFHPSNAFVDISSFWNSGYDPSYYLTALAVGYSNKYAKNWSTNLSHDFYFYNDTIQNQFNKAAQVGNYFDYKWLNLGLDYSFLYGNSTAHRLMFNGSFSKSWQFKGWLKSISLNPGFSVIAGNSDIIYVRQSDTPFHDLLQILRNEPYPQLERKEYLTLASLLYQERNAAAAIFLNRRGFNGQQITEVIDTYYEQQIKEDNVFGLMNYGFNMPVFMQVGKFSLMLNYTYNIPMALPNEPYEYEPNGFLSVAVSYMLYWK
ncbi:hypothetical protein GCM10027429_05390 [Marivirga atlantica]|uniref:Uncharacterized protein n=1 Tax=Marivirga atlantica TaxID=1548457 RepID=A0A937DFW9_9BACT|nr:hypothetical protein [Marivirga atlantica]